MKKKNVNKLLALGLVSAMTAGMLAGCGNTASTTTDNGAADTTVTEAADDKTSTDTAKADNGEVPTLIWWSIGGTPPDDFDKTIAEISDYTEEKIGVRLDVKIASWADWGTKMNNIVNTGEYFDLMFVNNTNYSKFVNLNALAISQTWYSLRHLSCMISFPKTCGEALPSKRRYTQFLPTRILL